MRARSSFSSSQARDDKKKIFSSLYFGIGKFSLLTNPICRPTINTMSDNKHSSSHKTPTSIKIAGSDGASQQAAEVGPGDPAAAPSEAPQLVDIPAPPTPSQLVVKSKTGPSGHSQIPPTSPTEPSGTGTGSGPPPRGTGIDPAPTGTMSNRGGASVNASPSGKTSPSSKISVGGASSKKTSPSSHHSSKAPYSVTGGSVSPGSATGTHHSGSFKPSHKSTSAKPSPSQIQPTQTQVIDTTPSPSSASAIITAHSISKKSHASTSPAEPPPGEASASMPPASGAADVTASPSASTGVPPSGTVPREVSPDESGPETSPSGPETSPSGSGAETSPGGFSEGGGKRRKKKKLARFRYHKRVTVRTKGNKDPNAIMDKVNYKDHRAGITPSAIEEMDPQELIKRTGMKATKGTHWRVRLRQTERITKNGKTITQTRVAYRDSEGNKKIKTSSTPNCQKCGKKLEDCECQ